MTDRQLDIQELVKQSGIPRRTIYFYVQQGILPSPHGAGLSAYYTKDHLLRLQLIPVLRQQGLRLDEIRQRLEVMDTGEMERTLASAKVTPTPQKNGERKNALIIPDLKNARERGLLVIGQYVHYTLPGGITLAVPEDLSKEEPGKVERLLKAATDIFIGDENGNSLKEKEK